MALPTSIDLFPLGVSLDGTPFCKIVLHNINPNGLDLSLDGSPWWGHDYAGETPVITGNIKAILKATTPNILKFMGVPMSNIKQTP